MTEVLTITSDLLQTHAHISHGFFTRVGGVSAGSFDSLNCSRFSGDDQDSVEENRRRVAEVMGCSSVVSLKQIHSDRVHVVDRDSGLEVAAEGDGLVTAMPGTAVGVLGADCAPVLFADIDRKVVGAAHGGWKGAVAGITDKVVATMESMGASRSAMIAAIGPSIQRTSYQVGEDFYDNVSTRAGFNCEGCFDRKGVGRDLYFDLPLFLEMKLDAAGVSSIERLPDDTYSDERRFFSYRRTCHRGEKSFGCQISAIGLTV